MKMLFTITRERRHWWQRLVVALKSSGRSPESPLIGLAKRDSAASEANLGVVANTPMGSMMSQLQRQSEAMRAAAEETRELARQVRRDTQAATARLRAHRNQEPPLQTSIQQLTEQVRELRERVLLSEQRLARLMTQQTTETTAMEVGRSGAKPDDPALVSEGQLSNHPILRHAQAANR